MNLHSHVRSLNKGSGGRERRRERSSGGGGDIKTYRTALCKYVKVVLGSTEKVLFLFDV